MKNKYYCKKCGIIVELEDFDPQFGELKKVYCSRCGHKTRMWKVVPKEKHLFVEDDVRAQNDITKKEVKTKCQH